MGWKFGDTNEGEAADAAATGGEESDPKQLDLFDEENPDQGVGDQDDEELGAEPDLFGEDTEKETKKTIPYPRFREVNAKYKDAKNTIGKQEQSLLELNAQLAELNGKVGAQSEMLRHLGDAYDGNPSAMLYDTALVDAIQEACAGGNEPLKDALRPLLEKVDAKKKGGDMDVRPKKETPVAETPAEKETAAPAESAALKALNLRVVQDVTEGMVPREASRLRDHLAETLDHSGAVTEGDVKAAIREYAARYGLKREDFWGDTQEGKGSKPPLTGKAGRAATTPKSAKGKDGKPVELDREVKSVGEWKERNSDRIQAFMNRG